MLKRLWRFRWIRIISGIFLLIVGILVGLLPGPGGFIFWLSGSIILLGEFLWLRPVAACAIKTARKIRFRDYRLKRLIKRMRIFIKKKMGWNVWFKKDRRPKND